VGSCRWWRAAALPTDIEGLGSGQFGGPTHGVKVSNDGLVYVADSSEPPRAGVHA
jgi:hypothetical protein